MIIKSITLEKDTSFLDKKAKEVTLSKGTSLAFEVESDSVVVYVDDDGNRYMSNDPEFPCRMSKKFTLTRPSVITELDDLGYPKRSEYARPGDEFELKDGKLTRDGKIYALESENLIEPKFEYPEIKEKKGKKVKASAGFMLDENKTYHGEDGLSALVVLARSLDIKAEAVRDVDGDLVVSLGSARMWPDCRKEAWTTRAMALMPVGCATSLGVTRLAEGGQDVFCMGIDEEVLNG